VQSAGGTIVEGDKVTLGKAGRKAAEIMKRLATSPAGDPSLSAQMEDQNRLAFEQGDAAFEVNYPYVYPSAKADVPAIFEQMAWRPYPRVDAKRPAKAPVGGINWGVGASTKHPGEAVPGRLPVHPADRLDRRRGDRRDRAHHRGGDGLPAADRGRPHRRGGEGVRAHPANRRQGSSRRRVSIDRRLRHCSSSSRSSRRSSMCSSASARRISVSSARRSRNPLSMSRSFRVVAPPRTPDWTCAAREGSGR
jgi:hypothetical protein